MSRIETHEAILKMTPGELRLEIAKFKDYHLWVAHEDYTYLVTQWDINLPLWLSSAWKQIEWPEQMPKNFSYRDHFCSDCPDWSGDPSAAWSLVEELQAEGWLVNIKRMPKGFPFTNNEGDWEFETPVWIELMWMPLDTSKDTHKRMMADPHCHGETFPIAMSRIYLMVRQEAF